MFLVHVFKGFPVFCQAQIVRCGPAVPGGALAPLPETFLTGRVHVAYFRSLVQNHVACGGRTISASEVDLSLACVCQFLNGVPVPFIFVKR